jgi:MscS family membrane protein
MSDIQAQLLQVRNLCGEFSCGLALFLSFLSLGYVLRLFSLKFKSRFDKSGKFAGYAFFSALANPALLLFLVIGVFVGVSVVESLGPRIKEVVSILSKASFVLTALWFSISYMDIYERRFYKTKERQIGGIDKRTINAVMKLCKALAIIVAIIFLMGIFGVDIRGILTVAGIGGAAIGFASKDLLANFFGALMLFIDKPFSVGDLINLPGDKEGYVEYIGWRVTKVRTKDTVCIYIANSLFSNMFLENLSMRTNRMISQTVRFKYSDISKLDAVTKAIRAMLYKHPEIVEDKKTECFLSSFEDSHVDCKVIAFTNNISKVEFLELNQKIMIEIVKVISKHKLKIDFIVRNVKLSDKR